MNAGIPGQFAGGDGDDGFGGFSPLKRLGQGAGLAARLLGQGMGIEADPDGLRRLLGGMRGPWMKIAQFLATVPDALPAGWGEQLLSLQSQAPAMGPLFSARRMRNELGADWQTRFRSFEMQAACAASIGQVHYAVTAQGDEVACKLQYPDMRETIRADLRQARTVISAWRVFSKALDLGDVFAEMEELLLQETDYRLEADNMAVFRDIFAQGEDSYAFVRIPKTVPELSTGALLTMSRERGKSLLSFADASQEVRDRLAAVLFKAWYYPLLRHGVLHGDPHPGNYLYDEDAGDGTGRLILLDFGCIRRFDPQVIAGIKGLYEIFRTAARPAGSSPAEGIATKDDEGEREIECVLSADQLAEAVRCYRMLGFADVDLELAQVLSRWAQLLFAPLADDRVRPIQYGDSAARGRELAREVYGLLHKRGGVRPPGAFMLLDRAAVGIGGVFMRLKARCNWCALFADISKED